MGILEILFYQPIFNLLRIFMIYMGNLGWAILALAIISRLVLLPFTRKQMNDAKKNKKFQSEVNKVKKKFKNNKEKQSQEMAKLQAKYLPGQIGGCLNLIITLVLLLQVRNVIIDLMNQGAFAYNQVAYSESLEIEPDFIDYQLPEDFEDGIHNISYEITASNGNILKESFIFAVAEDEAKQEEYKTELEKLYDEVPKETRSEIDQAQRDSGMSLFIDQFDEIKRNDPIVLGSLSELTAYIRPPSNETVNYDLTVVVFEESKVPHSELTFNQGAVFDYTFFGADLSKVATDFGIGNLRESWPYIMIAVSVGITQFFTSKIQMGLSPTSSGDDDDKKSKKKGKNGKAKEEDKKKPEDMDFSDAMAQSSKQMIYLFPLMTIFLSLGFMGGATFFPSGVSLFWTGQNTFVIIQQMVSNKKETKEKFNALLQKVRK